MHWHKVELDAEVGEYFSEDSVGTAVEIVGANHLVAGFQQFNDGINGGHSRSEAAGVGAVFQGGQVFLQHGARGVLGAGVLVALVLAR